MGKTAEVALEMFTIYERPLDYPGSFVVRRWSVVDGKARADPEPLCVVDTLDEARRALPPWADVRLRRSAGDPASIVESWL